LVYSFFFADSSMVVGTSGIGVATVVSTSLFSLGMVEQAIEPPTSSFYFSSFFSLGVRDGSVVVRCFQTRSRAQVGILGRLMVLLIPDSHLSEIRIMAVTTERKDGRG
jgi:hypothetical protein